MNDETLTLYYYDDGLSKHERQAVSDALEADQRLASRYKALSDQLTSLPIDADTSAPADMKYRWHDAIDKAADASARKPRTPILHRWSFLLGVAVTAALVVGISIGVLWSNGETVSTAPIRTIANRDLPANSGAFMRGLQVHLRESHAGLAAMPLYTGNEQELLVMEIIQQNRLYERAAEQHDARDVARVLRAFELVLMRLNATDITPEQAAEIRDKLLFELNVVLTKISRDTSEESETI